MKLDDLTNVTPEEITRLIEGHLKRVDSQILSQRIEHKVATDVGGNNKERVAKMEKILAELEITKSAYNEVLDQAKAMKVEQETPATPEKTEAE